MPYALSAARMAKYRSWFLDPAYAVTALPSYDEDIASNPFAAFHDLPLDGRYRFMLDEAEFFVMNFIKGPVCRGQLALDVIEDRFWVFFVDPNVGDDDMVAELLARERGNLRLPAERGSTSLALIPWLEYSKLETNYLRAKSEWLERHAVGRKDDLSMIWSRRWPQPKRSVDRVPSLRQCDGGQGSGRRATEDGVGHRLSAVRADLLPARGGLRRLRQRRPPVEQPPLHGLPAHGRRVQLPRAAAGESSTLDGRILVSRRAQGSDRLRLRPRRILQSTERPHVPDQRSTARTVRNAERASGAGRGEAI